MGANPQDGEFYSVVQEASAQIEKGAKVFQKFTCAGCKARQTMDVPNRFYTSGKCEECGHVTNLVKQGCGFMMIMGMTPEAQQALNEIVKHDA